MANIEETAGFLAAWNAPSTERPARPDVLETPGFLAAWNAPSRQDWRAWQRPACEMSREEAATLNCSAIDA